MGTPSITPKSLQAKETDFRSPVAAIETRASRSSTGISRSYRRLLRTLSYSSGLCVPWQEHFLCLHAYSGAHTLRNTRSRLFFSYVETLFKECTHYVLVMVRFVNINNEENSFLLHKSFYNKFTRKSSLLT